MQQDIEDTEWSRPKGGCPTRLQNSTVECVYCSRAVPRPTRNRTCAACDKQWTKEFGTDWFTQDWHTALIADHEQVFGASSRQIGTSELTNNIVADDTQYSIAPRNTKPEKEYNTVFLAIKDILLIAKACDDPGTAALLAGKASPAEIAAVHPGRALGPIKVERLLIERGFKKRPFKGHKVRGAMWLPSQSRIWEYIQAIRLEINKEQEHENIDNVTAGTVESFERGDGCTIHGFSGRAGCTVSGDTDGAKGRVRNRPGQDGNTVCRESAAHLLGRNRTVEIKKTTASTVVL